MKEKLLKILLEIESDEIYKKYFSNIPKDIFLKIISYDPRTVIRNRNIEKIGKYSKLILVLYIKGKLKLEDLPKVREYLEYVYKYNIPIDIRLINSLNDIYEKIKRYIIKEKRDLDDIIGSLSKNEYNILYSGNNWYIFQPLNERAACYIGVNTEWCTTWGKYSLNDSHKSRNSRFSSYNQRGILYILINKNNHEEKYQFHFESNQFADKDDRMINSSVLMNNNQELKKFFFPSLFDKEVNSVEIDKQIKRLKLLSFEDIVLFFKKTNREIENKLVNYVLEKDTDKIQEYFSHKSIDWVDIAEENIHFNLRRTTRIMDNLYDYIISLDKGRGEIYDDINYGIREDWEQILDNIYRVYFDINKVNVLNTLNVMNIDQFLVYMKKIKIDNNILDLFIDEAVDLTSEIMYEENNIEGNRINQYISFDSNDDIIIPIPMFISFLLNKEENTNVLKLIDEYISFQNLDYMEEQYFYTIYPEYGKSSNLTSAVDSFFDDLFEKFEEENNCKEIKSKFNKILKKYFKENNFENENVFIRLNDRPFNCEERKVHITFSNLKTNETYSGYVKVENLINYVNNYFLF